MDGVFYWILNMSILGSFAGALVFALRYIPRFPKFALYCLWGVVGARLIIPAAFASGWSFMGFLKGIGLKSVTVMQAGSVELSMTNAVRAAKSYFPVTYKEDALAPLFAVAAIVWASAACLLLLSAAVLYMRNSRLLKRRIPAEGFFISKAVDSPAVYGILKPMVLMPPSLAASADLKYILAHENVHVKRRDNLWRLIALLIGCVHWFNPLVWLFIKAFFADMEAACDGKALSSLEPDARKAYARALLNCAAKGSLALSFGAAPVKSRITQILTYRKMTAVSILVFAALSLSVAFVLLTNPAK